jgi:hypothetical protein
MVGIKHVNMEEKIYEVLRKHKLPLKKREELIYVIYTMLV